MLVGIPTEIKNSEYRVGMTPAGVRELVARGHEVACPALCLRMCSCSAVGW